MEPVGAQSRHMRRGLEPVALDRRDKCRVNRICRRGRVDGPIVIFCGSVPAHKQSSRIRGRPHDRHGGLPEGGRLPLALIAAVRRHRIVVTELRRHHLVVVGVILLDFRDGTVTEHNVRRLLTEKLVAALADTVYHVTRVFQRAQRGHLAVGQVNVQIQAGGCVDSIRGCVGIVEQADLHAVFRLVVNTDVVLPGEDGTVINLKVAGVAFTLSSISK